MQNSRFLMHSSIWSACLFSRFFDWWFMEFRPFYHMHYEIIWINGRIKWTNHTLTVSRLTHSVRSDKMITLFFKYHFYLWALSSNSNLHDIRLFWFSIPFFVSSFYFHNIPMVWWADSDSQLYICPTNIWAPNATSLFWRLVICHWFGLACSIVSYSLVFDFQYRIYRLDANKINELHASLDVENGSNYISRSSCSYQNQNLKEKRLFAQNIHSTGRD